MNFIKTILILLTVLATTTACNTNSSPKIVVNNNLRIISLVPSITKEIVQLGLKDNIVGATSYCEISKTNKDLIVGSAIEINEEKIMLLKPDIVFASSLVKEKSLAILRNNGIRVEFMKRASSFDDLCAQFVKLSQILDKPKQAAKYVTNAQHTLDSLIAIVPKNTKKPTIFFQLGASPIAAVIPNSFMNDFITLAGGINIFEDLNHIIVNRESVILRNPDYIFITSMGIVGLQEKEVWKTYNTLNAAKNNNIYIVATATSPTVNDFIMNFEYIINRIYTKPTTNEK